MCVVNKKSLNEFEQLGTRNFQEFLVNECIGKNIRKEFQDFEQWPIFRSALERKEDNYIATN